MWCNTIKNSEQSYFHGRSPEVPLLPSQGGLAACGRTASRLRLGRGKRTRDATAGFKTLWDARLLAPADDWQG